MEWRREVAKGEGTASHRRAMAVNRTDCMERAEKCPAKERREMQDERIYKLLTLVLLCRQMNTETLVGIEIQKTYEAVDIFNDDGENFRYATDCIDSFVDGNWHRIHDEDLEQAEQHLIRLLKVKEDK